MSDNTPFAWQQVLELAKRMRPDFRAFCASIDLLGVKEMMLQDPEEARQRLNDLQQGFGEALMFFPGGEDYRVCFLGDSLFVVKELSPDEKDDQPWMVFCGHIFALASVIQKLEKDIGNPGLRVVISYGRLFQIFEPDSWRHYPIAEYTKNWFVLTGASEALLKCDQVERQGSKYGFDGGYCWHELPGSERVYLGTPLFSIPLEQYQQPRLYPTFYREICERVAKRVELSDTTDNRVKSGQK